jgi:hypothetical protein
MCKTLIAYVSIVLARPLCYFLFNTGVGMTPEWGGTVMEYTVVETVVFFHRGTTPFPINKGLGH